MSNQSKGLVLVTGATGYIAGRTIEAFLQAGYSVRGTVRSIARAARLREALAAYGDRFNLVEVPDMGVPHAFDDAVRGGVTAVAHLASPVSLSYDDPEPVMRSAVSGVLNALESAATQQDSIKSFVFMSSIVAVMTRNPAPHTLTEADWNDWAEPAVAAQGKDASGVVIYVASKTAAERAFWKFRDERKPGFTMTALNPSLVAGPPLVAPRSPKELSETNEFVLNVLMGQDLATAGLPGMHPAYVDLRDVGRLAVFGVEHAEAADGQRYIAASGVGGTQAAADVLRRAYPERRHIIQEGTPGEGYLPDYGFLPQMIMDNSKAVKATGQGFIPYDQMVLDTAKMMEGLL